MQRLFMLSLVGFLVFSASVAAEEKNDIDAVIQEALSAGPSYITENATVHNWQHQTLREGSNGWTCLPTMPANAEKGEVCPMCLDSTWHSFMAAVQAGEEPTVTQMGISYMIVGDCGVSNIDPSATGATEDNQWILEGPHLMMLLPDSDLYDQYPADPYADGPYIMWKDTPYEHLMVPYGERPAGD